MGSPECLATLTPARGCGHQSREGACTPTTRGKHPTVLVISTSPRSLDRTATSTKFRSLRNGLLNGPQGARLGAAREDRRQHVQNQVRAAVGSDWTPESTAESDSHSFADWALTLPARTGLLRLLSGPLDAYHGLSPEQANAYSSFSMRPRSLQAWLDEGKGMPQSFVQAGAVTSFGATPLIVLSRDRTVEPDQDWQRMQTELLGLSSNSQQFFATESGHNVEFDQPQAAVGAIEKMVELTRHSNG